LRLRGIEDDTQAIAAYRVLPDLGLLVTVTTDEAVELADFRLVAATSWSGVAVCLIALLVGGELLLRVMRLRKRLEHQATRDPLTGLYNRRYFDGAAGNATQRARRDNSTFSIILADLDHFKKLNDVYGHAAGDQALVSVADGVRAAVRASDTVCRYGGEEILVLLPGCGLAAAAACAEAIRHRIAGMDHPVDVAGPPITASFGVAAYPDHGDSVDAVIRAADQALYRAKHSGRNRVVCAHGLTLPVALAAA
jgi:diguanylate cyclase (GGDEF)-like protein